jgi:REP element-mobilizing transposase RayT
MESNESGLRIYRNRLPQWRLDGAIYFCTWAMHSRDDTLAPREKTIVADCIKHHHRERYHLAIFVVMDDHVHVLVQMRPGVDLSEAVSILAKH